MKTHAFANRHAISRPFPAFRATAILGAAAIVLLLSFGAQAADVQVGFSRARRATPLPEPASVTISNFEVEASGTTGTCDYPALAVMWRSGTPLTLKRPRSELVTWNGSSGANPSRRPLATALTIQARMRESERRSGSCRRQPWQRPTSMVTLTSRRDSRHFGRGCSACGVNQTAPVLPATTSQAVSAATLLPPGQHVRAQ